MALSHQRDANARRSIRPALVAAPIAVLATATVVSLGILAQGPTSPDVAADRSVAADVPATSAPADVLGALTSERRSTVSRSAERALGPLVMPEKAPNMMSEVETRKAVRNADTQLWTTADLNLWARPGDNADQVGGLDSAKKVLVTGRSLWGRQEVVVEGKPRWVSMGYLSTDKPVGAGAGLSMAPCPDGAVENGLTDSAVYVYRSVCHAFPQITSYGGYDNHGEHASGRALDIMTSDVGLGSAIAEFLRAHAVELNLYDIIWRQQIFTQERGGEGWRSMSSRGSATANHFDHVHVSAY